MGPSVAIPVDGNETLLLILAAGVVAAVVLIIGSVLAGGDSDVISRRLEGVQQRHGAARPSGGKNTIAIRRATSQGAVARLGRLVGHWLPQRSVLEARLARTGKALTIGHYVVGIVAAGLGTVALAAGLFGLPLLLATLIGIAAGLYLPHAVIGAMGARRLNAFTNLFPDAIDLMVRGLKSGLPIQESIAAVGREITDPVGPEFRRIDETVKLGTPLEAAFWQAAQRIDTPEFKFFVIALSVQRETGGNLGETLDNLSDVLRKRRQMKLKVKALSSEARASAYIIGALPFIMFGLLLTLNTDYALELIRNPTGWVMLGAAFTSLAIGAGVMAKMVRFEI
jgi:tight adherence protein B